MSIIRSEIAPENRPSGELKLHPPNFPKRFLERLGLRDVKPADICPSEKIEMLCDRYRDLWGDWTAIGSSDDGDCQSWKKNPYWWRELVLRHSA